MHSFSYKSVWERVQKPHKKSYAAMIYLRCPVNLGKMLLELIMITEIVYDKNILVASCLCFFCVLIFTYHSELYHLLIFTHGRQLVFSRHFFETLIILRKNYVLNLFSWFSFFWWFLVVFFKQKKIINKIFEK